MKSERDFTQLKEAIIAANLDVHAKEARFCDCLRGELFNWFEQRKVRMDLAMVAALTLGNYALL